MTGWITRRRVLAAGAGLLGAGAALSTYALWIEPAWRLVVRDWRVTVPGWRGRPPLTLCLVADIHAGEPHMSLPRVERIVAAANALQPDLMLVMGDLPAHHAMVTGRVPRELLTRALSALRAPLGVHAVLGNHDWWDDPPELLWRRRRIPLMRGLLDAAGVPVLANAALRLPHGDGVWLAGLDSQWAFGSGQRGADDLPGTLAQVTDDAPVILLAHEPDIFPRVPPRVSVTLSGHTHGGQVRIAGYSPIVSSRFGNRYAWGLVREAGRSLLVSGGLGCSILPVRFGVPPELTLVRLSGEEGLQHG
ncbi:metallophosphoesterase [Muricoccus radiodurans]|uniref:metallophosphoesterase n=1 Tax=Muricoccus radiodurans TaxID=2231721 RepID=UPI003CF549C7